jgi:hypothetical protein
MLEISAVDQKAEVVDCDFVDLVETELAMVGGGTGDISLG